MTTNKIHIFKKEKREGCLAATSVILLIAKVDLSDLEIWMGVPHLLHPLHVYPSQNSALGGIR